MKEFEYMSLKKPSLFHLCCDNCSLKCECGSSDCGKYASYPKNYQLNGVKPSRERNVQPHQMELLSKDLHAYHKTLVMELVRQYAHCKVKVLTDINFLVGFSDLQISQVLQHCNRLFTFEDIYYFIEIWDIKHAAKILGIIESIFADTEIEIDDQSINMSIIEDELELIGGEWNCIFEDEDLLDLIVENFMMSYIENSIDKSGDGSVVVDMREAAWNVIEKCTVLSSNLEH